MASLICPTCGKDNPDFLDDCQFCQTPLRREALNIGEGPTKKSTGELEGVLPDWLKEARQQARETSEVEDAKLSTQPKIEKVEPPDLLAGLAFQAASDEEEVPDWLASLNPVAEKKAPKQESVSSESEPLDFFAQFNTQSQTTDTPAPSTQSEAQSWTPDVMKEEMVGEPFRFDEPQSTGTDDWLSNLGTPPAQESAAPITPEDLGWLHDLEASTKSASVPASQPEPDWMSTLGSEPQPQSGELDWLNNLGGTSAPAEQPAQPAQEDLSWLNNLGGTPAPVGQPAQPAQEDLSWLNNLGGTSAPAEQPAQPAQEDLSWLNNLGGTPAPAEQPAQPVQEDLSWLNNLGGTPAPAEQPAQPAQEDLSWLNNLGGTPAPAEQPVPITEDMGWLNDLAGTTVPAGEQPASTSPDDLSWLNSLSGIPEPASEEGPVASEPQAFLEPVMPDWLKPEAPAASPVQFSPPHTAPLSEEAANNMPDWLRSAASEAASMPPLGAAASLDWIKSQEKPADELPLPKKATGSEAIASTPAEPAALEPDFFAPVTDASSLSSQQVDDLFAVDMPDWLTQDANSSPEISAQAGMPAALSDSLAPVDLPSWVQAMRPVDAVIEDATVVATEQNTERDGPLAGLRGVIPVSPIGSAQRPRAISLKLQASEEQQVSASLMEQIIAGESMAQALRTPPLVSSQRILRWILSVLFLLGLGAMLGLGTRTIPVLVSPAEMVEITAISNILLGLPEGAPILVVMDYEAALAGEMEAAAGPLLDQLVMLRRPTLTFISSTPNGSALVDRLLKNTGIGQQISGSGIQPGTDYLNAGYLPGGSTGVQAFIMQPAGASTTVQAGRFADYAAVIVITDQAESGLVWVEQLTLAKQSDPSLAEQPLLIAASAQAGPMLEPYVASQQVAGMVTGLAEGARYEFVNNSRPGAARGYWDAFGAGLMLAILAIGLGSVWNVFAMLRRNPEEQG